MERLLEAVTESSRLSPEELIARVLDTHEAFVRDAPQYDDMTIVAMKWLGECVDTRLEEAGAIGHAD
jgi:serine phosphatase RsbU (regulator of sigma subunit)